MPRQRAGEGRWAAARLLLLFALTRLLLVACAALVEATVRLPASGPGGAALRATSRPILGSLTAWDGVYYLEIARAGYHAGAINGPYPDVTFFPLFPALVRVAAAPLGGDVALAGVLVANLALLAALPLVYALARRRLEPGGALLTSALVAVQPGAVALGMAYSDSLFLLLTAATFLAAERRQRALAGGLAFLAGLARLPGALLAVPLLVIFAGQDSRRRERSWLWALGAPLGLAAFCAGIGAVTGDPLAPLGQQAMWDPGRVAGALAAPWVIVVAAVVYGGVALVALRLLVGMWRRPGNRDGLAWTLATLALVVGARRVASLPRFLVPLVQLPAELAAGGTARYRVRLVVAAAVVGWAVLAGLHFAQLLAP